MNILLLRGLSREQRHWGGFPDVLRQRLAGSQVFCLDLPGTGTEYLRPSPADIKSIAEDVRLRWTSLRDSETGPWTLVAISLGGMVAMQWCAAHPEDFARVVLCNTSASNLSRPWKRFELGLIPSLIRAMAISDPVERERIALSMTTRVKKDLDLVAAQWASYQADQPVTRTTLLRQLFAATRFRAANRLAIPVLVLSGAHDPMTDPSCPKRLADHFGGQLLVHPEAGHELALDAPDWFADSIATWIERQARETA